MAIAQPIAGAYNSLFGGAPLTANAVGYLDENGWELEQQTFAEQVDKTDIYGDSLLDLVYRGGNVTIRGNVMTYSNGVLTPFFPWVGFGQLMTTARPIAQLGSNVANSLVLNAVLNTPAQTSNLIPQTLTASKCILPPNANLKLIFTSKVRKVPLQFALLPSESSGTVTWFTYS